jgi:hypothetical protein
MREIRRQVRQLPRERRREIGRAIREGRAVGDPRDAALTAAWAEQLNKRGRLWPWWIMPRRRPTGWRAWAWIGHALWMVAAAAYACVAVWPSVWPALPGIWRWVLVGFLAYGVLSLPVVLWFVLRIHWNASEAARHNRDLATHRSTA